MTMLDVPTTNFFNTTPAKTIISYRNYSLFSQFDGEVDPEFFKSINTFWLHFDPPSHTAHYVLAVLYILIFIIGCSGNLFVIYMYIRCRSIRTPANTLVINLAVSDFFLLAKTPIFIHNSIHFGPALGDMACRIYGFVGGLTGTVSITTLTAIAYDRYHVVVYPLDPLRSTTKRRVRFMVVFVWLYSFTFAILPALDIGMSKYVPEGYMTSCSFDYLDKTEKAKIFMFVYFIFAWVLPFTGISFCYFHILRVVIGANSIQSSKDKNKTEVKLAFIVIAVIGLWFLSWTPYAVVALLGITSNEKYLTPTGSMMPALFCKMASCVDPYVYAVTHPRFRQEFKRMFLGIEPPSKFQGSQYSRGPSRRTVRDIEVVGIHQNPAAKRDKFGRGENAAGNDSTFSVSLDVSEVCETTLDENFNNDKPL